MKKTTLSYKTIFLSDVHLGTLDCKIDEVNHFLKHTHSEELILNGDIIDGETAKTALAASGADGVMIGRAAIGCPWLPGQIEAYLETGMWPNAPNAAQQWRIFSDWYGDCLTLYGEGLGLRVARKHIAGFIESLLGMEAGRAHRAEICRLETPAQVMQAMHHLYDISDSEAA